ncbi:MAG: HD domain-containing protein, partial [Candidatus Peregrinibacteria bacterium]|nr:HD domain-containing protein [Candidatus Peregrinibacteria bacterium]
MTYTAKFRRAIKFAIKTHEVYQKQTRKGKNVAYITHPLTVGIILANIQASEDVVVAGILHDTIEDSVAEKKVTKEMLTERFGEEVARLVLSVTELNKELPWEERKQEALNHIRHFDHDSLLVKSADVISNVSELVDDYNKDGEQVFLRFNAPKEKIIGHQLKAINTILEMWDQNPLAGDLSTLAKDLLMTGGIGIRAKQPAPIIEYRDYDENAVL